MRTWLSGLLRRRWGRLGAASVGVAMAVALLASLGGFLATSRATMTARATSSVAVDWQVQATPGAAPDAVLTTVTNAPGTTAALPVTFVQVGGFTATIGGTTQTTGSGVVLGLPDGYRAQFPATIRSLTGAADGVLVAQQTAANLHVAIGDLVDVLLADGTAASLPVDGVVDLPSADSLFQRVGAPPQSQPIAPPDNVVLVPQTVLDSSLGTFMQARPDLVTHQVHAARSHDLPTDPAAAYVNETGQANNLEVDLAGAGLVGDNLGATLDAARSDALYAQVLFLFLGLPGAMLAGLLTAAVAGSGAVRRRREHALLRTRGATAARVLQAAMVEAAVVAVVGTLLGLGSAALVARLVLGTLMGAVLGAWQWVVAGGVSSLVIATATVVIPVRRALRESTVHDDRLVVGRESRPAWMRWYVDLGLLALAGLTFWITGRGSYKLVLAPEGVPTISVSYWAFLGPALLWIGSGLLCWRLVDLLLTRGRRALTLALTPLAGPLAGTVASSLGRQRRVVARSVVLLALAVSFGASTATFNATYRQQAEVDARLTAGADVTVTQPPGAAVGLDSASSITAVPGVQKVEPLQHRYAYVGNDLQDLYGVRPSTVASATSLQDAYFRGGTADELMARLAAQPDAVLVSEETVHDFQLVSGDRITLRLQDATTQQYVPVEFTYTGVVKEFPTAPTDSFLVANGAYIAQQTHSDAVQTYLIDTSGASPSTVADRLRQTLGTTVKITDISTARTSVGSSLTSVELGGLTKIEIGFSLLLAAAAGGLVLALGLTERRRTYALASALGARRRQIAAFIVGEAALVGIAGLALGWLVGAALSQMLVKVLNGVFDPPPTSLAVPYASLGVGLGLVVVALCAAVAVVLRVVTRPPIAELRRL
ncbi:MAG: FtsX-like permease family protein [Actinomycetes bacterium]